VFKFIPWATNSGIQKWNWWNMNKMEEKLLTLWRDSQFTSSRRLSFPLQVPYLFGCLTLDGFLHVGSSQQSRRNPRLLPGVRRGCCRQQFPGQLPRAAPFATGGQELAAARSPVYEERHDDERRIVRDHLQVLSRRGQSTSGRPLPGGMRMGGRGIQSVHDRLDHHADVRPPRIPINTESNRDTASDV
jgi:hypothetical protein